MNRRKHEDLIATKPSAERFYIAPLALPAAFGAARRSLVQRLQSRLLHFAVRELK
jgi:hypothetical protein